MRSKLLKEMSLLSRILKLAKKSGGYILETMEVSVITGHKDMVMLKRYTYLKAEHLAKKQVLNL